MITRNLLTRSYKLLLTLLVLLMSTNAFAQRLTATGKVTDAAGLEVIGASVLEKGTANGVVTNLDGEFSLSVGQNATLVISFIGYKTIEVKAATNMNITLQEDNELLDEVVVIGYGSVKRKDVTTAVSTVSTKDLDQRPIVSTAQALQGKAAGVSVMQPSGEPGGGMSIRVRGTTSFNGSNDPLYVVDGVPVDNINLRFARSQRRGIDYYQERLGRQRQSSIERTIWHDKSRQEHGSTEYRTVPRIARRNRGCKSNCS